MPSFEPLVNEYRGDLLDLVHMGYVCVVDENSKVIASVGDADEMVFYRSASKPLQALPVIARGWILNMDSRRRRPPYSRDPIRGTRSTSRRWSRSLRRRALTRICW